MGVDGYVANGLGNTDVYSTGTRFLAATNLGSFAGLIADVGRDELVVYVSPGYVSPGYVSRDSINGTSTWSAQTYTSLGLVSGRYIYNRGSGADADSMRPLIRLFSVGGSVCGLTSPVVLQNNGGDDLAVSADSVLTFPATPSDNTTYGVTVATQPEL